MILLCFDFLVFIVRSKYHDPLHVLLDYIAKVSADVPFVFIFVTILILTWTVQRAPDCDMALVHDDDLERILEVGSSDGTVSKNYT